VSTVRVGAICFKIYPEDHEPPHAHAFIGSGEVIIDLCPDGSIALARRKTGAIRGRVTRNEVRKALEAAVATYVDLVRAWEAMHDEDR
jgi:uncharacterized protein DUF4160